MPKIIDQLRAKMQELRAELKTRRPILIQEARELFAAGLDGDEVYAELRDRYLDSIPVIAEAADDAVDWSSVLDGAGGDLLEAIDGKVVDALLRLVVQAADRRRRRRGPTLGELAEKVRLAPAVIGAAKEAAKDESTLPPSRSGGLGGWNGGMGAI